MVSRWFFCATREQRAVSKLLSTTKYLATVAERYSSRDTRVLTYLTNIAATSWSCSRSCAKFVEGLQMNVLDPLWRLLGIIAATNNALWLFRINFIPLNVALIGGLAFGTYAGYEELQ